MHDPMTVAFEIVRPWPRRTVGQSRGARWKIAYRRGEQGPWVASRFWTLAGREYYWPAVITIWHHDPGGYDSGDRCPWSSRWRWHVHHWRVQIHTIQRLRRWWLTRCEWCGGKSRKGDYVNCSVGHKMSSKWWQGEQGLFHADCSAAHIAWATCTCDDPWLMSGDYGPCIKCDRFRPYGLTPEKARSVEDTRARSPRGARPALAGETDE